MTARFGESAWRKLISYAASRSPATPARMVRISCSIFCLVEAYRSDRARSAVKVSMSPCLSSADLISTVSLGPITRSISLDESTKRSERQASAARSDGHHGRAEFLMLHGNESITRPRTNAPEQATQAVAVNNPGHAAQTAGMTMMPASPCLLYT